MQARDRLGLVALLLFGPLAACGGQVREDPDAGSADAGSDLSWWRPEDHLGECCSAKWGVGPRVDAAILCGYNYAPCHADEYCGYSVLAWKEGHVLNYYCATYGSLDDGGLSPSYSPGKPTP